MLRRSLNNDDIFLDYVSNEETVLDFGCGVGNLILHLKGNCKKVVGCDIAKFILNKDLIADGLEIDKDIFLSSEDKLPFLNKFDVILSDQVFEHVKDHKKTLIMLSSSLIDKGRIYLNFPTKEILIEPHLLLPLIHRFKFSKFLVRFYLKLFYSYKLLLRMDNYKSFNKIIGLKDDYLFEKTNYLKKKELISICSQLNLSCKDLSKEFVTKKYQHNLILKIIFFFIPSRYLTSSFFEIKKNN